MLFIITILNQSLRLQNKNLSNNSTGKLESKISTHLLTIETSNQHIEHQYPFTSSIFPFDVQIV